MVAAPASLSPKCLTLPCGDQIPYRAGDILDGHVGIDTVLVEEVDGLDPQPLQRALGDLADAFGAAVKPARSARTEVEAELGGDDDVVPERLPALRPPVPRS